MRACSGGSDWRTIKVMRIDQASGEGEDLSDLLEHVKFSSMAWTHDNKACPLSICLVCWNSFACPHSRALGNTIRRKYYIGIFGRACTASNLHVCLPYQLPLVVL